MKAKKDTQSYETMATPHPWLIAGGVVGFILFAAIAMGVLRLFLDATAPERPYSVSVFQPPRLQIDPAEELQQLDEKQGEKLTRTQWRDRNAGVLTIPIGAAMAAIAGRGPKAYDPLPAAESLPSGSRPADATAPEARRPNPGSGAPSPMQEGQ